MFTTTEIVRAQTPLPAVIPAPVQDRLQDLWSARRSANTRRGYQSDWRQFEKWCFGSGHQPMPCTPQVIAAYLDHMMVDPTPRGGSYSVSTITRHMAAISHQHNERGVANPCGDRVVLGLMEGVRRRLAGRPKAQKAPVLTPHLRKGLRHAPKGLIDQRNRALLLIGFAGAFRRSELVAIDMEHCAFDDEGRVRILVPRSKTDQTGQGAAVWILPGSSSSGLCPVKALREWIEAAGITSGPVFRSVDRHRNVKGRISSDLVPYVVKRFIAKVGGLDPAQFAGHSLRSGHVTQGFLLGAPADLLMRQGRWRSIQTVMGYNRDVDAARHNSSAHLGL